MNKIRYHHLLCINYFKGYGYSDEFIKNMYEIISNLKKENKLELTTSSDDICKACPNLINGICKDKEKTDRYDLNVKNKLIHSNIDLSSYDELNNYIVTNILPTRESICGDCQWKDLCKNK